MTPTLEIMYFGMILWSFSPGLSTWNRTGKVYCGGSYYLLYCMNPNILAMREGNAVISELEGMGFDKFDVQVIQRWTKEL
jgi:hypothetical protein